MRTSEWQRVRDQSADLDTSWFNLHITPKFYLFTQPKIASSWADDRFGDRIMFPVEMNTLYSNRMDIDTWLRHNSQIKDPALIKKAKAFYKDWISLVEGKSAKKDFIFLIRNPIDKRVAGFIQDVLLYALNDRSLESPFIVKYLVDEGISRNEIQRFKNATDGGGQRFPYYTGEEGEFLPILRKLVKVSVDDWFANVIPFLGTVNCDHKHLNYFIHYKLLIANNNKVDKSKIKIIDIDRQDIGDTLKTLYDIKIDTSKLHERPYSLKTAVYEAFVPHLNKLMSQTKHECLIYCDLINSVYRSEMYRGDEKKPDYIFSAEEFVEKYKLKPKDIDIIKKGIDVKTLDSFFRERARRKS